MTTTFQTAKKNAGSNRSEVNVDRDGKPFGQIWTFTTKNEHHGIHAKTLKGDYKLFEYISPAISPKNSIVEKIKALEAARAWMAAQ